MSFSIQHATPNDREDLAQIYLAARRTHFFWEDPRTLSLADFDRDSQGEVIHTARAANGLLTGFVSVFERESFIHLLFVAPGHEHQGIGSALLQHLETRLRFPHQLKCVQVNEAALAFYQRQGWKLLAPGYDGRNDYYLMEKTQPW